MRVEVNPQRTVPPPDKVVIELTKEVGERMNTIWKYEIKNNADNTVLNLPLGYKVRTVGLQGNVVCVWVEVDEDEPAKVPVTFYIFGTGWIFAPGLKYVGTVHPAPFVWHIFYSE